jgi:hypothetical protein
MVKPRRKVTKQKALLRSIRKKQLDEEVNDDGSATPLRALREKQKERRRRLLWGDEPEDDDTDDEDHDGFYDEDDEDECATTCPNPDCRNYSIAAADYFEMPENAVIAQTFFAKTSPIERRVFSKPAFDLKGKSYGCYTEYPISPEYILLSFHDQEDLVRIARDGLIVVDQMRYLAYVAPANVYLPKVEPSFQGVWKVNSDVTINQALQDMPTDFVDQFTYDQMEQLIHFT